MSECVDSMTNFFFLHILHVWIKMHFNRVFLDSCINVAYSTIFIEIVISTSLQIPTVYRTKYKPIIMYVNDHWIFKS